MRRKQRIERIRSATIRAAYRHRVEKQQQQRQQQQQLPLETPTGRYEAMG
jgi:hypothetical protein